MTNRWQQDSSDVRWGGKGDEAESQDSAGEHMEHRSDGCSFASVCADFSDGGIGIPCASAVDRTVYYL